MPVCSASISMEVPSVLDLQHCLQTCVLDTDSGQMAQGVVLTVLSLSVRDLVQHLMCLVCFL